MAIPFLIIIAFSAADASTTEDVQHTRRNFLSTYEHPPQLPEIIINRANTGNGGYNYPIPSNPPIQLDEPVPQIPSDQYGPPLLVTPPTTIEDVPISSYLPPNYPPIGNPPIDFEPLPTLDTPLRPSNPGGQYLPPSTSYGVPNEQIQLRVFNMSCLDSPPRRFFRASLRTSQYLEGPPVIDDAKLGCIIGSGHNYNIDVDGFKMSKCGVKYCSNGDKNLCMQVRMPAVRGLRLPEDQVVTLQCRPQDVVVEKTRHLKLNPQVLQGRSAATVALGGSQRNFETEVALYRKAPGGKDFTQLVSPGSSVQLGEELLLRAAVRDGDGWKYSRMGAVVMQRIAPTSRTQSGVSALSAVTLVDTQGCRVPAMKSVCPEQPRQINSLTTTMPFRAFMFQNANNGDEMVLSVRMLGCLQYEDCYQARSCEEKVIGRVRARRQAEIGTETNATSDWQSFLEFRVVVPENRINQSQAEVSTKTDKITPIVFGGLGLLCMSAILIIVGLHHNRTSRLM